MEQEGAGGTQEGLGSPVEAGGGPGAGAPALAKDELICVHRALMLSLSLAPGGSISGTGGQGEAESVRGPGPVLDPSALGRLLTRCVGRW